MMQADRVVPVIRSAAGKRRVGSGYRIAGRYVLTAAHCVRGSSHRVLLPDGERHARVVADGGTAIDLALLEIIPTPGQALVAEVPPTWCGRVDRDIPGRLGECVAVGYPRHAASPEAPFTTAEVDGWIPAASGLTDTVTGRTEGLLTLKAEGTPPRPLPTSQTELGQSAWAGMSGAAVFARGLLVGVVAEHHLPEGDGSLTVVPITWAEQLTGADRICLLQALAVESAGGMELIAAGASARWWTSVLPDRPAALVERPELLAALRQALLTADGQPVVLAGMGGAGKSVLAAQMTRAVRDGGDAELAAAYPAGVAWVTVGLERAVAAIQLELARAFGEDQPDLGGDWRSGRARMQQLAAGQRGLLVLDDVWTQDRYEPFRLEAHGVQLLITTRNQTLADEIGGVHLPVGELRRDQSRELLAFQVGLPPEKLPAEAGELLSLVGDLALGVAMVGGVARDRGPQAWPGLLRRLRERQLDKIAHKFADNYEHATLLRAIEVAVDDLDPADQQRWAELAVFAGQGGVPESVIAALWQPFDQDDLDTGDRISRFLARSLLQAAGQGRYRLHDLQYDVAFLRLGPDPASAQQSLAKAHQRLLKGTGQGGLDVPIVRGYLAEHRIWHLIGAHDYESVANELTSPESLVSTALDRGVRAVEYDLALALAHCSSQLRGKDRLLRLLLSRIRQSIDLLERCDSRESFCPTLAGRLQGAPELADFAVSLGRCVEDGIIHVEGPPHDSDDRRLVLRLPKQGAGIKALSWMAEPDQVGIAFRDGAIRLWDPSSKRLHQSRGPDLQQVMLAAWASSGVLIAIGRFDGSITVWPLPDGDGPEGLPDQGVAAVAWSRTGELAYAGWAGALARWSRRGGTQWCTSNIGGARVRAMAWSDDSARLAFGSAEGAVFIFSEDGPAQLLGEHRGGVASLAWSARGRLACAGWEGTVRVVEPDARPAAVQPKPSDRRGPAVIAWDEDGHQLGIGGFDGAVAVWSAGQCRTVLPPQSGAVRALAWSPTAPLLAAGHDGGVVRIWHETDRPFPLPILAHQTNVVSVAWSSRREHLATAGSDGAVAFWAPFEDSGALLSAIRTHGPTTVRCSPDGRTVATAEQAGAICLWDVQSRQCRTLNSRAAWTPAIGWAPVGAARLVTGGADGVVYEWNAERESDSRVLHHHAAWVSDLAWTASSRGEQLATLGRDWVIHINQPPDPACELVAHEGGTTAMAWSPRGSLLATAGNDWLVRIWRPSDATSGTLSADRVRWGLVAQFRAHLGGVAALEWAPGGAELATAGWDRSVRRWRLQTVPEPSTQPDGSRPMSWCLMDTWWTRTSAAAALAWSPDGASVVGGDRRGKLRLWRCGDLSVTEFRPSHQGLITALRWPKRTNRILSAGTDGTLRVWDASGQERARVVFRTPLYSLDLHEDSGLVAVGGEHGATILRLRAERRAEQTE